jgi:DNA replication protein DnaC
LTQPKLLVLDEFGYRRLDEDGRALLFEVVNARYLKGSIITGPTSARPPL